ncbi:sensor histidine kinase [Halobacteriovorax sp. ZH4_bin.1]|uniref:sensor histidine kinase n=1 Tax=unclassified Halobacteriovorax TaxID=2639665 RepID=UPI003722F6A8
MHVSNKAYVAYIDALKLRKVSPQKFFEELGYNYAEICDLSHRTSWQDFTRITRSFCGLVPDYAQVISHTGVENSIFRAVIRLGAQLVGEKSAVEFLISFAIKSLYQNISLNFNKKSGKSLEIEFCYDEDTPPLDELSIMYAEIFKCFPVRYLGHKKDTVVTYKVEERKVRYCIHNLNKRFRVINYFKRFFISPHYFRRVVLQNLEYSNKLERQKLELEVMTQEQNRLNSELLLLNRTLNHDIYNKLQILNFAIRKIKQGNEGSAIEKISLVQESVMNIIKNSSKSSFIKDPFEVKELMLECKRELDDFACDKNIEIDLMAEDGISISSNRTVLKENILINLLQNAIKFSHPNSKILIKVSQSVGLCHIEIQDEGVGISKERIRKLLSERRLTSNLGTDQEVGTGSGLMISLNYIEELGGRFDIKSREGAGTDIIIKFPLS